MGAAGSCALVGWLVTALAPVLGNEGMLGIEKFSQY
jgi:hypothetical protein